MNKNKPTPEDIIKEVCKRNGININQLQDFRRDPTTIRTCILITKVLKDKYSWSYNRIGKALNRDHTTIMDYYNGKLKGTFAPPPTGITAGELVDEMEQTL